MTRIRDGVNTGTQNFQEPGNSESQNTYENRRQNQVQVGRGLHESYDYYTDCAVRKRNECELYICTSTFGSTYPYIVYPLESTYIYIYMYYVYMLCIVDQLHACIY